MTTGSKVLGKSSDRGVCMGIRAVAFDLGDTLVPTRPLMRAAADAAAEALAVRGLISRPEELVRRFFEADATADFPHINHLFSHLPIVHDAILADREGIVGRASTFGRDSMVVGLAGTFLSYYRDVIRRGISPRANISAMFREIRERDIKVGVISNGSLEEQLDVVARLELMPLLDDVLISEELNIEKPDPAIFHAAAERLGVDPGELLYVGDDPEQDGLGAVRAGLSAAVYVDQHSDNAHQRVERLDPRISVIYDLHDVLAALG
jgi:putative hydrolase of the HAD superfamily